MSSKPITVKARQPITAEAPAANHSEGPTQAGQPYVCYGIKSSRRIQGSQFTHFFPQLFHDFQGSFSMAARHYATVRHFLFLHNNWY